jgi:GNAT superfamily N-acetyltransferase
MTEGAPAITCRAAAHDDGPVIARLFGVNGACAGCWCMHWRVEKGGATWRACRGEPNRRAFLKLLRGGRVHGALAFAGERPVGWCNFGPRTDFPRLRRSRVLAYEAAPGTWSVNCFFVAAGWRRQGVASALLRTAMATAFARGARVLEGYPPGGALTAPFAWTGTRSLFARAGFKPSAENPRVWLKRRGKS